MTEKEKFEEYERRKALLREQDLSPKEFEEAVKQIAKELDI